MKKLKFYLLISVGLLVTGCANQKEVTNFASESAIISSNKAVFDNAPLADLIKKYNLEIDTADLPNQQRVANSASIVLSNYMTALSKINDGNFTNIDNSISNVQSSLSTLTSKNPDVKAASAAVQKTADWMLRMVTNVKVVSMIKDNDNNIQTITSYLSKYAKQIEEHYIQINIGVDKHYSDLKLDQMKCRSMHECATINAIVNKLQLEDDTLLKSKIAAIEAASVAFDKIGKDHHELAQHIKSPDLKEAFQFLQQNEPYLLDAISAINKL